VRRVIAASAFIVIVALTAGCGGGRTGPCYESEVQPASLSHPEAGTVKRWVEVRC
jgi:predicted small lipoprotein YifL